MKISSNTDGLPSLKAINFEGSKREPTYKFILYAPKVPNVQFSQWLLTSIVVNAIIHGPYMCYNNYKFA